MFGWFFHSFSSYGIFTMPYCFIQMAIYPLLVAAGGQYSQTDWPVYPSMYYILTLYWLLVSHSVKHIMFSLTKTNSTPHIPAYPINLAEIPFVSHGTTKHPPATKNWLYLSPNWLRNGTCTEQVSSSCLLSSLKEILLPSSVPVGQFSASPIEKWD